MDFIYLKNRNLIEQQTIINICIPDVIDDKCETISVPFSLGDDSGVI